MAELGDGAEQAHREVREVAQASGVTVVAVDEARYGADASVEDPDAAVAWLRERGLSAGDAVLVKASRAARLERVVAALEASP